MKTKLRYHCSALLLSLFLLGYSQMVRAQNAVIEQSRFIGGSGNDVNNGSKTVGGNTYVWGTTTSAGLPVTNGSSFAGGTDIYIAKYNSAGTLLFATYFGGSLDESWFNNTLEIVGDEVFIAGRTTSGNLPVTNGSAYAGTPGTGADLFVAKINSVSGAIGMCTYYGVNDAFGEVAYSLKVANGDIYLSSSASPTHVITTGVPFGGGNFDYALTKFNGNTGSVVWATVFGGDSDEFPPTNIFVVGNEVHVAGYTRFNGTTFTASTDGTTRGGNGDVFYGKFNATTGAKDFFTFYGSGGSEQTFNMLVDNGEAYIYGYSIAGVGGKFPTTDGSLPAGPNGTSDFFAMKYTSTGTVAYATLIGGSTAEASPQGSTNTMAVSNGSLYFIGATASSNFPTTNGSVHRGATTGANANDIAVVKLSPTGAVVFATQIGDANGDGAISITLGCNDEVYVLGDTKGGGNMPVTMGSSSTSGSALFKWNTATGQLLLSTYVTLGQTGGPSFTGTATPINMEYLSGGIVQVSGQSANTNYAVTTPGMLYGGGTSDMVLTRINTCPTGYAGSTVVTPATQTVCVNGVVNQIVMDAAVLSPASSPTVYLNGVASAQLDVTPKYQWQVALAPGGPWTDVGGAIGKNYVPASSAVNKYYRRTVLTTCCGVITVQQTGDVAAVLIGTDVAPTVNLGPTLYNCPRSLSLLAFLFIKLGLVGSKDFRFLVS